MSLATFTNIGRAAIALAISNSSLTIAWGTGDPSWYEEGGTMPDLLSSKRLVNEVGRRIPTFVGFVLPDDNGDIVVPTVIQNKNGETSVTEKRYIKAESPTPFLYIQAQYGFEDAANSTLREMGIFMGGTTDPNLPPGQRYFLPAEVIDPGYLLAVSILDQEINRSGSVQQTVNLVIPF